MRKVLSVFCLLALMFEISPKSITAAPVLELRDRFDIQLEPVRRLPGAILIRGQVTLQGGGVAPLGVAVDVAYGSKSAVVSADGGGNFSQRFARQAGERMLSVNVAATAFVDAAYVERAGFDIQKGEVSLHVSGPTEMSDGAQSLQLMVSADSDGQPVQVPIGVFLRDGARVGRQLTTGMTGIEPLTIPRASLGAGGRTHLELRFSGSSDLDAASANFVVTMTSSSQLTLGASKQRFDYGEVITVHGRLETLAGEAIAKALITVSLGGHQLADARTDDRGDYRLQLQSEELGSGRATLGAEYRPTARWKSAAHSAPLGLEVGDPTPLSLSFVVATSVATALVLLSFLALRAQPWKRWQCFRGAPERPLQGVPNATPTEGPPATGLATGSLPIRKSVRKAQFSDFHTIVVSAIDREPVSTARLRLGGGNVNIAESDSKGELRSPRLDHGSYALQVCAQGFVSEIFKVHMPHRGEFHNTTVSLMPVREAIFTVYKAAVRAHLPGPEVWGIWSPRQILEHVRGSRNLASQTLDNTLPSESTRSVSNEKHPIPSPNDALATLTDFVEENFFSQRDPSEEILPTANSLVLAFQKSSEEFRRP